MSQMKKVAIADAGRDYRTRIAEVLRAEGSFERVGSGADGAKAAECVAELLRQIGIPAHLKGHQYLREAIMRTVENADTVNAATEKIYPDLAKEFHTTESCVERAIRHAVEIAWSTDDPEALRKKLGNTAACVKGKPTDSAFIAMLAETLRGEKTLCI